MDSVQYMMDTKKSKYKDDYSLRTLAYYQREGGIYNELITILQRIRVEKGGRKLLAPNKILNIASEAFDIFLDHYQDEETESIMDCGLEGIGELLFGGCSKEGLLSRFKGKDEYVILCVLCVLLAKHPEFFEVSIPQLAQYLQDKASTLYESFWPLINREMQEEGNQLSCLKNQLEMMKRVIREKDEQLGQLSDQNSEQQKMIDETKGLLQVYMRKTTELTKGLDGALSLDAILEWISKRKHYKLADQVITMLKDLGRKTATDDELDKIDSVEEELLSKYSETSIVNYNTGIGSNMLTGLAQNPMMPFGVTSEQLTQKFIEYVNNGAR